MLRRPETFALILLLATVVGCGGDGDRPRVVFATPTASRGTSPPGDTVPPASPTDARTSIPTEPTPQAATSGAGSTVPSPTPGGATAQPSATPPTPTIASPTPSKPPDPSELEGGPFIVDIVFEGKFRPLVALEVRSPEGKLLVRDYASEDGYGLKKGLKFLPAGRYNLKVYTEATPDYPIYHKNVTIFREANPTFKVGRVTFRVPPQGAWTIDNTIAVELVDAVAMRPVYKGLLKDMNAYSIYRDKFPRSLILPFGKYAFGVYDTNPKDAVKIATADGAVGLVKVDYENNVFSVTETAPLADISLEGIIVTPNSAFKLERKRK